MIYVQSQKLMLFYFLTGKQYTLKVSFIFSGDLNLRKVTSGKRHSDLL